MRVTSATDVPVTLTSYYLRPTAPFSLFSSPQTHNPPQINVKNQIAKMFILTFLHWVADYLLSCAKMVCPCQVIPRNPG